MIIIICENYQQPSIHLWVALQDLTFYLSFICLNFRPDLDVFRTYSWGRELLHHINFNRIWSMSLKKMPVVFCRGYCESIECFGKDCDIGNINHFNTWTGIYFHFLLFSFISLKVIYCFFLDKFFISFVKLISLYVIFWHNCE